MKRNNHIAGNILFLILLAVVLFAALAYAVTSSLRGGGNNASSETVKLTAAQILQQLSLVENTVQRMIMMGVKPENLNFNDGSVYSALTTNPNCSTDDCRVFKQMTLVPAPRASSDQSLTFSNNIWTPQWEGKFYAAMLSIKGVGTSLPEIVIGYKGLNLAVCNQINIQAGVYAEGSAMINVGENYGTAGTDYQDFQNSMDPLPTLTADKWGSVDSRLVGKTTFCFLRGVTTGYYVIHVIYPR